MSLPQQGNQTFHIDTIATSHRRRGLATLLARWFCPNLNLALNYNRLAKQINPEIRNPTRCDGATARREEARKTECG